MNMEKSKDNTKKSNPSRDTGGIRAEGHLKIWDPESKEVYVNQRNAIHYENFSYALANCLANKDNRFIHEMQDRKSTRLNSSHSQQSRMPSSA